MREPQAWCERAGVIPVQTVTEVRTGLRASPRCHQILADVTADVTAGVADLVVVRDVSRLSEDRHNWSSSWPEHKSRLAISRDDQHH